MQQKSQIKYVVCKMYPSIAAHSMSAIFTDMIEELKEVIGPCLRRREAKACVHINIPGSWRDALILMLTPWRAPAAGTHMDLSKHTSIFLSLSLLIFSFTLQNGRKGVMWFTSCRGQNHTLPISSMI